MKKKNIRSSFIKYLGSTISLIAVDTKMQKDCKSNIRKSHGGEDFYNG